MQYLIWNGKFIIGDIIIKEGTIGTKMYFIQEGIVDIVMSTGKSIINKFISNLIIFKKKKVPVWTGSFMSKIEEQNLNSKIL